MVHSSRPSQVDSLVNEQIGFRLPGARTRISARELTISLLLELFIFLENGFMHRTGMAFMHHTTLSMFKVICTMIGVLIY
jgi:hypothetical protein